MAATAIEINIRKSKFRLTMIPQSIRKKIAVSN